MTIILGSYTVFYPDSEHVANVGTIICLANLGKLRHSVVYAGPAKTPKMMECWAVILISGKKKFYLRRKYSERVLAVSYYSHTKN